MFPQVQRPILVLGDLILDEYLVGRATRLSREAAVPVLERTRRRLIAGGAANPAVNVAALDGHAIAIGVVGNDSTGNEVRDLLTEAGVDVSGVVTDASRPTTTKTRIVAEGGFVYGQHLARIDYLDRRQLDAAIEAEIAARLEHIAPDAGALVVSNYRNGVITDDLIALCRHSRTEYGLPLLVDSQGDLTRFTGFNLIKCNRAEAEAELEIVFPEGPNERAHALETLRSRCEAEAVVVTLGSDGIAWLDAAGYGQAPPLHRATVFDTTGAGDTVIAVLALGRLAGLSLAESCELANAAAGLVVQVLGNYAPSRDELAAMLRGDDHAVPHVTPPLAAY